MGKAEAYVENYLGRKVYNAGGLYYKFTSADRGVPDRIVILKGRTVFVEAKAEGEKARRLQQVIHKRMRGRGADVRIIDTREDCDAFLEELLG